MGQAVSHQATSFQPGIKTELYMGLSKTNGGTVTESEFDAFITKIVTPLFPDGLTIQNAVGQYRNRDGTVGREGTKVLIIVHPNTKEDADKIALIVATYDKIFSQTSVLQVDIHSSVSY